MGRVLCLACATLLYAGSACAAFSLIGTRIVYPVNAKFADVTVENVGNQSGQMVAWVDEGDADSTPETSNAPFLLAPAVKVLGPGRRQVLRISYTGPELPLDRETVYYLNVMEIPPKPTGQRTESIVQFAVRTRIKIFMRPGGLPMEPSVAAQKVAWELDAGSESVVIRAKNPSPYFISLGLVKIMRGDTVLAELERGMVPPWGQTEFRAQPTKDVFEGATTVRYRYINDYGGAEDFSFSLPLR